jgi:23S rRNA (cytidine1920-2'-O)/16S rRNA (cytidine1409-2'-O)-methyltransferase
VRGGTVPLAVMPRVRIDALLAERGLFESRSRAAAAVMAGDVLLLPGRERASKPGQPVAADVEVEVVAAPPFVSRGGVKLANALDALGVAVAGRSAVDIGASTGGFTDCLLQRGVARVCAVDVAYGELHWSMREDPRVTVMERVNARALDGLPYPCDLAVCDVSFISVKKVLPALVAALQPEFDALIMVKPQFEVGRDRLGKGGVVRDAALRREVVLDVAASSGCAVMGFAPSGLPGPKGNLETFVWLAEPARAGSLPDPETALAEVAI